MNEKQKLLAFMFDVDSHCWNLIWVFFILLGTAVFVLGIVLMVKKKKE